MSNAIICVDQSFVVKNFVQSGGACVRGWGGGGGGEKVQELITAQSHALSDTPLYLFSFYEDNHFLSVARLLPPFLLLLVCVCVCVSVCV